ncbi:MAG TPA: glycosyltransferase family 4 protein [Thermoanaerobacterales bacterium]|nr:glycosyltransferase family 4 protein [Thermoanaerobacterales bacterium]
MRLLFCHDGPMAVDKDGNAYPQNFTKDVFSRYYAIADKITFLVRTRIIDPNITKAPKANMEKLRIVSSPNLNSISGLFTGRSKAKKIIRDELLNCDFLIARLPSQIGTLAIEMTKKYNKPYLIELVGCPWDAYWNHSWKGKLFAPFMWYVTKKMVKNAPYVLYVTNDFLQRRYPSTGRTINCSDVALPTLDESVLDARLQKIKQMTKNKPVVIGTTAAVDVRYKGQEYVIQAIAELNKQGYNFEYRLVGGGDKTYLQSIAENYGVADKVIFEGSIPHEKVFDYLDSIDIYVQPSKTEGLPRALIEAMSRGCPCIGSKAGGIPELLDTPFIFNSGNVQELANILASFDTEKMIKQAKRNFEFSKEYAKEVIETRRNEFFKQFAESVKNL